MNHSEITNRANNLSLQPVQKEENVHSLNYNGRYIILIGTAHISKESSDLAEKIIKREKPDVVCVELCHESFEVIKKESNWRETDIVKIIRGKRISLLLSQLLSASIQKMIAQKFGIHRDDDMLRAIAAAEENKAQIVFADREIRISLLRVWRRLPFISKVKLLPEMFFSLFIKENITEEDLEKLKEQNSLELAMRMIADKMPGLKTTLFDERDQYLAHAIGNAPGRKIVAVIGTGHVPGVINNIGKDIDVRALLAIPSVSPWVRMIGGGFLLFIIALFIAGFFFFVAHASMGMILGWSAVTASFSGLGALLLLAHPVTIMASAFAAPVTTLHPLVAAGWVAALTEVAVRKPKVEDFLDLADDITSIRGFFSNRVTRLLLLVAVVNLTTSIGTFVAIPLIMRFL